MNRSDWNLLVLSAADGQPVTPAQLQKCLFLLGKAYPGEVESGSGSRYYHFKPYNYGAFDAAVYFDAEQLERDGLIRIKSGTGPKQYAATPEGRSVAADLLERVPAPVAEYLKSLVNWARGLSFADLIRSVYDAYPETREKSIFKG